MAAALIVIEISASSVSDEALGVLVSACTRAARGAECVLAKDSPDDTPSAVAIVSLQGEDKMRVEVGVHQGEHDSWRTKDFAFLAMDEILERWRAVGFAIGTLAENNPEPGREAPTPQVSAAAPQSSTPVLPARPAARPTPGSRLFVAALGTLGPGLNTGPWRIGSGLRVEFAPPRAPLYFALGGSAATRIARDETGASARWYDVSLGSGIALVGPLNHSGLQLSASLLAEYFDVSATELDGLSESKGRWLFGVEGALGGRIELFPDLFVLAEFEAAGLSAATDVIVSTQSIGSASSFRYLGSLGIRVRLR